MQLTHTVKNDFILNMRHFILFFPLFLISSHCSAVVKIKKEKKVLFIGNSLTYYHDMPQTVQKMIDGQKMNIKIDQSTPPGAMLSAHAKYLEDNGMERSAEINEIPTTVKKILGEKWDMVVLQEQGGSPLIPEFRLVSFEPSLVYLDSIIKSINGKTVLYQAYAGNKFPGQLCQNISEIKHFAFKPMTTVNNYQKPLLDQSCSYLFKNSNEEFQEIKKEYDKMAKITNAGLVKVGYAFEGFKKKYPKIQLYEGQEDNHPSKQGSYLIACLFFRYITGKGLNNVKYTADLDVKQARLIRKFADSIK